MTTDDDVLARADADGRLDLLVGSTLFLMSAYRTGAATPRLARAISGHLDAIAEREDVTDVLRSTCEQLARHWSRQQPPSAAPAPGAPGGSGTSGGRAAPPEAPAATNVFSFARWWPRPS